MAKEKLPEGTKYYKLLPGKNFDGIAPGGERRVYEAGSEVPLNETQYAAFKDRFAADDAEFETAAQGYVAETPDGNPDTTKVVTEGNEKGEAPASPTTPPQSTGQAPIASEGESKPADVAAPSPSGGSGSQAQAASTQGAAPAKK